MSEQRQDELLKGSKPKETVTFGQMTCEFFRVSVPLVIRQNLVYLIFLINVIFAGRLNDPAKMAGVGLGTTMNHILGLCILFGMNNAMDTLISQAHGSGNLTLCGVYLNRARVIGTLSFIPVGLLLFNVETLLLWLKQDPETVKYASQYSQQMIPAIYVMNVCDMQEKFLVYMQYPAVVTISQAIATVFHAPLCYYFVEIKGYGIVGLSYSSLISYTAQYVFLLIFSSRKEEIQEAVQMPNAASFSDWASYLELAVPAVLQSCSDWWAIELLVFISGYLGVIQQASYVILVSISAQLAMVPIGLSVTACTLIGNAIGQKEVDHARRWFKIISGYTLIYCIAMQFLLIPFKEKIAAFFTMDELVRNLVIYCIPVVSLKFIPDGYQGVLGYGVMPALSMQKVAFKITLAVAYLVTLPSGYLMAFTLEYGVVGLVYGAAIGHATQATLYWIYIVGKDWVQVSEEAAQRIEQDNINQKEKILQGKIQQDDCFGKV